MLRHVLASFASRTHTCSLHRSFSESPYRSFQDFVIKDNVSIYSDNLSISSRNYATYFYLLHGMSSFYDRRVGASSICFSREYRRRLRYGFSSLRYNLTATSYPCKHLCLFDNRGLHGNTSLSPRTCPSSSILTEGSRLNFSSRR